MCLCIGHGVGNCKFDVFVTHLNLAMNTNATCAEDASICDIVTDSKEAKEKPLYNTEGANICEMRGCTGNAIKHVYFLPLFQVFMLGMVFFMCPGMLNALQGIGGGGQIDTDTSSSSSIAIYATFSVGSIFAGTVVNNIGTKMGLIIGSFGYTLYFASYLCYNITNNQPFVIAAGAILGVCAGLLWASQGAIMLSIATPEQKGRFISLFWILLSLGSVIGSAVELGMANNGEQGHVSDGTYGAFLALGASGGIIAALMYSPSKIIKSDGARVEIPKCPGWIEEFKNLFRVLVHDYWVLVLIVPFVASNWYYTWQFNVYNVIFFSLRARALNNLVYWIAQIMGSYLIGLLLDYQRLDRRTRSWIALGIVWVLVWGTFAGNYVAQVSYDQHATAKLDYNSLAYVRLCILYIFNGLMDSIWQCFTFYIIGAMSDDLSTLAHIAGVYKGVQSAGAAGAFGMNLKRHHANGVSFIAQLAVPWALCAAGAVCFVPVIAFRISRAETRVENKHEYTKSA